MTSLRLQPGEKAITAWVSGPRDLSRFELGFLRQSANKYGARVWVAAALLLKINPQAVVHGSSFDERYPRSEPHVFDETPNFMAKLDDLMCQRLKGGVRI